jgi:hypothetical protein
MLRIAERHPTSPRKRPQAGRGGTERAELHPGKLGIE